MKSLSQWKYVVDLLFDTGKSGAKPCSSSMAPSLHLSRESEMFRGLERYRKLVRKMNYLTDTS